MLFVVYLPCLALFIWFERTYLIFQPKSVLRLRHGALGSSEKGSLNVRWCVCRGCCCCCCCRYSVDGAAAAAAAAVASAAGCFCCSPLSNIVFAPKNKRKQARLHACLRPRMALAILQLETCRSNLSREEKMLRFFWRECPEPTINQATLHRWMKAFLFCVHSPLQTVF